MNFIINILWLHLVVFGGGIYPLDRLVDEKREQIPETFNYHKSNDSLTVEVNIVDFTDDIVKYSLLILTNENNDTIKQEGFAINPYARLSGGSVFGNNDIGEYTEFREYYSFYCDCDKNISFSFKISKDKRLLLLFSSRKVKSQIYNDFTILEGGHPKESLNLFGFIPRIVN